MSTGFTRIWTQIPEALLDAVWLGRAAPDSTRDKYVTLPFSHAERHDADRRWRMHPLSPRIVRLTRHASDDAILQRAYVIVRYATKEELAFLQRHREDARIIYLLDDDPHALARDPALPGGYRLRMQAFSRLRLPRIVAAADRFVAPTQVILDRFSHKDGHILHPAWIPGRHDLAHHDQDTPFRIVFAGSRSHLADLEMIAPALRTFLQEHADARLETFLGRHAPSCLKGLPNIVHHQPLPWIRFREWMLANPCHVFLAPMRATAANRARSFNKMLDAATLGAALLCSPGRCPALDEALAASTDPAALALPDSPEAWLEALNMLHHDATRRIAMARRLVRLAQRLAVPDRIRQRWEELLAG